MLSNYYYNSILKKTVSVFGTLFNNIITKRVANGDEVHSAKVPLSYGPRAKFIERLRKQPDLNSPKLAIKLPRMSFEVKSMEPEAARKLNPLNVLNVRNPAAPEVSTYKQGVPYILGIELSVYGKNLDDVLQIIEQIIPNFSPAYTVTVMDLESPGSRTDIPIVLNSISPSDSYEGPLNGANRVIVYALNFSVRVLFATGGASRGIIRQVDLNFFTDLPSELDSQTAEEQISISVDSQDSEGGYTATTHFDGTIIEVEPGP